MSPRRLLQTLGLGALVAGLAAACLSWTVAAPGLSDFVSRELTRAYGVALTAEGRAEAALLPLPRITFAKARITAGSRAGPALAEGGALAIQLNLLGLLMGRAEVNALSLDGATLAAPSDPAWAEPGRRLAARLSESEAAHPRRVTISRATILGGDSVAGAEPLARDAGLTLSWPLWSPKLDAVGAAFWRGGAARLVLAGVRPRDLLAGAESPFAATASWPSGSLAFAGSGRFGHDGPSASGALTAQTRSLPETLAWIGGSAALSPLVEALAIDGSVEASRAAILMPTLRVTAGGNALEGAGSLTLSGARPAIQATLAAESLTLSPLLAGALRLLGLDGGEDEAGPSASLALGPLTSGDLDLRLSAGSARLGPLVLDDVAASVLASAGGIEASLIRAGAQGGSVKGRIALSASGDDAEETEIKAQGAFERLDLGAVLTDLGQPRWVLGPAQGHFAVESRGRDMGALARRLGGRAALGIDGGAITGLDLSDVAHRRGAVAQGALARRNGRTAFSRASLSLRFADGIGEIVEGSLAAPALTASLRGAVSLPERLLRARADIQPLAEGQRRPAIRFELSGPWDAVEARATQAEGEPDPLRSPASATLPAAARAYAP